MLTPVRKIGNAPAVIIPKRFLDDIGARQGGNVELHVEGSRRVISPAHTHLRAGWAEASQALAEAGDDALTWPEFANADDVDWSW